MFILFMIIYGSNTAKRRTAGYADFYYSVKGVASNDLAGIQILMLSNTSYLYILNNYTVQDYSELNTTLCYYWRIVSKYTCFYVMNYAPNMLVIIVC